MPVNGAPATSRRRPRWVRLRALLAVGLLCGAGTTMSLASWTDQEQVAGTFTAAVVDPVNISDCRIFSVLGLGPQIRIFWTPPPGYELDNAILEYSPGADTSDFAPVQNYDVQANTSVVDGGYRTIVPLGLLDGLAGLNRNVTLALSISTDSNNPKAWSSERSTVVSNLGVVLGLNATCRLGA